MTEEKQMMAIEMQRVRTLLAEAIAELEADGGDIRYFTAAFMAAAMQLQCEVEGEDSLNVAITRLGVRTLTARGARQC